MVLGRCLVRGQDVAASLRKYERLRRYRTHLELAQSVAGFGSWEFDPLHQEFLASDQAWRLAGIAAPEGTARVEDWLACVHEIDRDRVSAQVMAAFDRVEPFDVEFRVIWPDGSVKWQEARAHLVGGDGDEPPRLIGVTIDITDRKQVELHLLFRNDFQRLISSLSTEFIHVAPQHLDRAFKTALERVGQTARIHDWLAIADLVALPSESLYAKMDYPLVLLEAMSLARPILVTTGTAAEELAEPLRGEGAGPAVAVEASTEALVSATRALLDDDSAREVLGERARRAASARFGLAVMADAYERLYDALLG